VGGQTVTISHLDRHMYLLGYIPRDNRIYLIDKSFNVVSYSLHLSIINYQTAILRGDLETASNILPKIPNEHRNRIAQFLDSQGLKEQALEVSIDPDHKFELAIQLGELQLAREIAETDSEGEHKWRQLGVLALSKWDFELAEMAMWKAEDFNGLLLLYTSLGNAAGVEKLAQHTSSVGRHNVAFTCLFLLNRISSCLDLLIKDGRYPEAAFMARSYAPSQTSRVVNLWRAELAKTNPNIAKALADPAEYPNLFTDNNLAIQAEKLFRQKLDLELSDLAPAIDYLKRVQQQANVDLLEEAKNEVLQAVQPQPDAQQQQQQQQEEAPVDVS